MDNVSHTLASIALGAALCEIPPFRSEARRSLAFGSAVLITSFIANNLPDLDTIVSYALQPGTLGELLNHRGYTHSFVFVPIGGLLAAILAWSLLWKRRQRGWFWKLWLVGMSGVLLHLFMDLWNDYGIHPLWPWSNRWFYGDTLNVIEPLFWFALLPLAWEVLGRSRVRLVRGLLIGISAGMFALIWIAPYTRGWVAVFITLWAMLAFFVQRRFRGVKPALVLAALLVTSFAICSRVAHARVRAMFPGERIFQLIAAPAPSDPFCFRIIVVSDREDRYTLRLGAMSLWPSVIHPRTCWYGVFGPHNAHLTPVRDAPSSAAMQWSGEFVRPMSALRSFTESSCEFAQFRRFSRAPYWERSGAGTLVGDLRYDQGKGIGFSEFLLKGPQGCLHVVPPWQDPVRTH